MCHRLPLTASMIFLALPRPAIGAATVDWVVDAARAKKLIAGGALVLDTRSWTARLRSVKNAVAVSWRDFSREDTDGGRLRPPGEVAAKLRALGLRPDRAVVVIGAPPDDWGEDGRIVWMLHTLGHRRAALVDGGYAALRHAGVRSAASVRRPGDFKARVDRRFSIDTAGVRALLGKRSAVLVDTRTRREYEGATPHGERRGGHLPGAVHLHFKSLLDGRGRLLPPTRLRGMLTRRGITPDKTVVAYCTGGVRSAWLVAVLVDLGYPQAKNYAGSMWEWAAKPAKTHPLVRSQR